MSLAIVGKNDALDVVKVVTGKHGFECWRRLCKESGSTTGTSLHDYSNLLEYDFGTTDGFKKKLLKWENQIADFQKSTGESFSDRLKCAIVLSRSPGPIRTYLRVQNRGNYNELRLALMNYLEAEVDDSNGPVPMDVGAMKSSDTKGEKGKKGYGKGYEKGKGKGPGKEEKPPPNSSFAGHSRSCGKLGHRANECWQGYVHEVEDLPSSYSISTVRSAGTTTTTALKTAAVMQKVDEDESGWIFGMVSGSEAAAKTDRDEAWDELVLDSGSDHVQRDQEQRLYDSIN